MRRPTMVAKAGLGARLVENIREATERGGGSKTI
jgi:hypothetical protein